MAKTPKRREMRDWQLYCLTCSSWNDVDQYYQQTGSAYDKASECKKCTGIRKKAKRAQDKEAEPEIEGLTPVQIRLQADDLIARMTTRAWDFEHFTIG